MKTAWVALLAGLLGAAPSLAARPLSAQELFPFDVDATPVVMEEAIDTPFAVPQYPPVPQPGSAPQPDSIESVAPMVERLPAPTEAVEHSLGDAPTVMHPAAEAPAAAYSPEDAGPSLGDRAISPELWIYLQERNDRLDPRLAVRAKAALEAEQRQARIATRKWYGTSLARPTVSPTPFMSGYAPGWEPAVRHQQPVALPSRPAATIVAKPDPNRSHDPYGRGR